MGPVETRIANDTSTATTGLSTPTAPLDHRCPTCGKFIPSDANGLWASTETSGALQFCDVACSQDYPLMSKYGPIPNLSPAQRNLASRSIEAANVTLAAFKLGRIEGLREALMRFDDDGHRDDDYDAIEARIAELEAGE